MRGACRIVAVLLITLSVGPRAGAAEPEGLFITQIAIDPQNPKTIYTLTTYGIGLLKSTDGGERWSQINQGIKSYSLYQLTVHPKKPKILYLGAGGAGLYKSTDGGASWSEMNDGLQNTDIGMLVLHPNDPETVYVVTSTGLFKSPDGGKNWIALNQGDNFTSSQQYQSLIVLPTSPPTFYLASKQGLYTRKEGDSTGWVPVGGPFTEKKISALARDPRTGRLYAAVVQRGTTIETLREGGLFVSDDGGTSWTPVGQGLEGEWIRYILLDPRDPQTIYLTTTGSGILKSTDGGKHFKEINEGFDHQVRDIRALVMDPRNPGILYAGSHGRWVYQTRDAGKTWKPLPLGLHQTIKQILTGMNQTDELARKGSNITPPGAFEKCNRCHGWTDSVINRSKWGWRVAANRRDWNLSVKRMSKGARLTPEEEVQIAGFLNSYTQGKRSAER